MSGLQGNYHCGNLRDEALDGENRGWVIGSRQFLTDVNRQSEQIEVKYWELAKGQGRRHSKISETLEWTYILKGRVEGVVGNDNVILCEGDYVLIQPGTPNNIVLKVTEDAVGITVKSPSVPTAKHIIQ